ncbi:PAP/25A-associated [Penicillium canescens]|uniref:PAP/25A-associated n=1 Tax=Penicillium canescens TaxID=5083 RepID=A0AAD6IA37_PENCN|nr:PAP/25A-associated [Penicillium canescens]KAJ6018339.1 PAP/25A-associated [Penicillium canescens]KAJ6038775.1 PAP/25A-associated [Penicillium canescens]KAJ6045725.1 PAP/25A-associated [Penicillium canescens]KAJ6066316.1 PAP/25A-associated [Penicillium canescens]KAJ6090924.1 PAP/25A-associated [Penicillium canescens]
MSEPEASVMTFLVSLAINFGNPDHVTIEDPNNIDDDILGGTSEINLILRTYASAHTTLKNLMEYLALVQGPNKSILGPIIATNFEKYPEQRNQLRWVFMTENRFASETKLVNPRKGQWWLK